MSDWEDFCNHLDTEYSLEDLMDIAEAMGVQTTGKTKQELCKILTDDYIVNNAGDDAYDAYGEKSRSEESHEDEDSQDQDEDQDSGSEEDEDDDENYGIGASGTVLPVTVEEALERLVGLIEQGEQIDGRWVGPVRLSTGYKDHKVFWEEDEAMTDFDDPNDKVSKLLDKHQTDTKTSPGNFSHRKIRQE